MLKHVWCPLLRLSGTRVYLSRFLFIFKEAKDARYQVLKKMSSGNEEMAAVEGGEKVPEGQSPTEDSSLDTDPYHYTKRGEFTSELYKIEIFNLPKYFGFVELRKLLKKLGLNPIKLKRPPSAPVAFVTFSNEEERTTALSVIKGHKWKKRKLDAKIAKPVSDPVTLKRKNEAEGREGEEKIPKLSIEESVTPLAHLPYMEQLKVKQKDMVEFLKFLGTEFNNEISEMRKWLNVQRSKNDGKCCELEEIKPSPIIDGYRNKCEFTIGRSPEGKDRTIGFRVGKYREGFTAVASPLRCRNLPAASKKVVEYMQQYMDQSELEAVDPVTHEGHWSLLTVRTTQGSEVMATLSLHLQDLTKENFEEEKKKLKDFFSSAGPGSDSGITSLYLLLCGKGIKEKGIQNKVCHITGNTHITEELLGLKFRVSREAFFQVNAPAAEVLLQTVGDWAAVSEETVLLDVCCGTGTIGLSLAKRVKRVVGVDICQEAVDDAKFNAQSNGITNAKFICDKAENVLPTVMEGISKSETVIAVLDPPRAGVHVKVIRAVRKCEAVKRLVFLSCNPRYAKGNFLDLCRPASLKFKGSPFRLVRAVPVDMFPHSPHCELVLLFERENVSFDAPTKGVMREDTASPTKKVETQDTATAVEKTLEPNNEETGDTT